MVPLEVKVEVEVEVPLELLFGRGGGAPSGGTDGPA